MRQRPVQPPRAEGAAVSHLCDSRRPAVKRADVRWAHLSSGQFVGRCVDADDVRGSLHGACRIGQGRGVMMQLAIHVRLRFASRGPA